MIVSCAVYREWGFTSYVIGDNSCVMRNYLHSRNLVDLGINFAFKECDYTDLSYAQYTYCCGYGKCDVSDVLFKDDTPYF